MNFGLAREIYGLQPWCMDQFTLPSFTSLLRDFRNGVVLETPEIKSNTPFVLIQNKDQRVIKDTYQLRKDDDFDGVGLIQLDGPITKKGGMSTHGMVHLASTMNRMSKDDRIKSFIIYTDSGGGSSAAVDILADTINEIKESKPVHGLIEKGGMAASAAFGILSACNSIYAIDKMSIVGSVGTMIAFDGKAANSDYKDTGEKHIRLYATKSVQKNKAFEEALNNDNYELIVNDLLDPINEDFIKKTVKNRPQLKGSGYENGHHLFAKNAVGTFIDGFKTFDQMVNYAFKNSKKTTVRSLNNVKSNSNTMNVEELRQNHPDTYNSVFKAGAAAEKDRTGAWLAHIGTNQETVVKGIKSGDPISDTQREELVVEAISKRGLKEIEADSPGTVKTKETKPGQSAIETEQADEENKLSNMLSEHLKAV